MVKDDSTEMMNMMFFANYSQDAGVKFCLDSINAVNDPKVFYYGLVTVSPTAKFYKD